MLIYKKKFLYDNYLIIETCLTLFKLLISNFLKIIYLLISINLQQQQKGIN